MPLLPEENPTTKDVTIDLLRMRIKSLEVELERLKYPFGRPLDKDAGKKLAKYLADRLTCY